MTGAELLDEISPEAEAFVWSVIFGEFNGGSFDWDQMVWRPQEDR